MKIQVYRITDSFGNVSEGVFEDSYDIRQVTGLKDQYGVDQSFESDARHMWDWAVEHDFYIIRMEVTLDIDNRKCLEWSRKFD